MLCLKILTNRDKNCLVFSGCKITHLFKYVKERKDCWIQYFLKRTNRKLEIFFPSVVSSTILSVVEARHGIPISLS